MNTQDNLIDTAMKEGAEIFFAILDQYPELDDNDSRRTTVMLSLYTNTIIQLRARGFTERELVNMVFDYCDISDDLQNRD